MLAPNLQSHNKHTCPCRSGSAGDLVMLRQHLRELFDYDENGEVNQVSCIPRGHVQDLALQRYKILKVLPQQSCLSTSDLSCKMYWPVPSQYHMIYMMRQVGGLFRRTFLDDGLDVQALEPEFDQDEFRDLKLLRDLIRSRPGGAEENLDLI